MIEGLDMTYQNQTRHTCSGQKINDHNSYHCIIIIGKTGTAIGSPVPAGADDGPHKPVLAHCFFGNQKERYM